MNAHEARAITEVARRKPLAVGDFVSVMAAAIERYAESGESYIEPWKCLEAAGMDQPTEREKLAIVEHWVSAGFQWHSHPFHPMLAW